MGILTSVSVDEIRSRGSIRDSDVQKLACAWREHHTLAAGDADALFMLDAACPVKDPAWSPFLIEAITDYVVYQAKPEGYLVAGKAQWLIEHVGRSGPLASRAGLELVAAVLERARWSPASLAVFALSQVLAAVVSGSGPLRVGQASEPGAITQADIDLLSRFLLAFAGDGGLAVTRAEADVLLAIDRAILPGRSSPAWTELYVKAVGNGVLSGLGMVVPDRAAALGAEAWLAAPREGADAAPADGHAANLAAARRAGGFAGHMIAGGAGSVWSACRRQTAEERALQRLERQRREIITGEPIAEADEGWLLDALGGDRTLGENESALLSFLQREAVALPPAVAALAARASLAA